MADLPGWARNPDVLEKVFLAAVGKGDAEGVEAALTLMAGCDPHRAQRLLDDLRTALHIADAGDFDVRLVPR